MIDYLHGIKVNEKVKTKKKLLGEHKIRNPNVFKGYAGLTHTAKEICEFIPRCNIFVEPFAGLGRISKNVKSDKFVLNDLSDFAVEYLKKHFFHHTITQVDYMDCIKEHDSPYTLFFLDPPWLDIVYDVNPLSVLTEPAKETYEKLEKLLPTIQGNWIIAGKADGVLSKWGFYHKEIRSKKNYLFGFKARTYLVSNVEFVRHNQEVLF